MARKCVVLVLVAVIGLGISSVRAGSAEWVLKAGHVLPVDHPYHLGYQRMDEELKKRSGGRITLEIYPNSQLGNERDLFEGCQIGTVDLAIGATAPLANFTQDFLVFDLPYLFVTKDHAYAALDGQFGIDKLASLEDHDMIGLSFWEVGYFHLLQNRRPITKIEDAKGMSIRVMENVLFMEMIKALDANPVPMAWSEVFTSIQNGTVDGTSNPIVTIFTSKLYTVAKYFTLTDAIYSPAPLIMSKETYDSMPPDMQQLMRDVANEVKVYQRALFREFEERALRQMAEEGVEITTIADKEPWSRLMKEKIWPNYVGSKIDKEDVDLVESFLSK
ncbi:MAG: TRAP transporter substrate-binding protein DctP [Planctomycetota bacterium]|jgi:tripartite ATP-independent transporter DctP family solute receptor|nr:TRAP transporter substrate-binding protein DctP [Planctomycetota bacterium]